MCGIVAIHDPAGISDERRGVGRQMLERIRHRGPDGIADRVVGTTYLGHVRLSIVDLADGDQPLGPFEGHWAVVNGEIYNHHELRKVEGLHFRDDATDSDSEAALAAAVHGHLDALADLRGMYAFVVAHPDGRVLAVRDPLGVKPLYWARDGGATYFASELVAFPEALRPAVEEFPPGHRWTPQEGLVRFRELHVGGETIATKEEARELIRETLITAVRRRMMADVPVGVFLSGGLDSSLVAAIMARHKEDVTGEIHSFAAGTAGSSDLAAARRVADDLGLVHHEITYTADEVVDILPEVVASIESYEPSLVRSAVPNYLLSKATADVVKVVLTGEGADELFAGYAHYRDIEEAHDLAAELLEGISGLHNLNLQRCDRVTMAHGLEARVPFLDRDLVNLAGRIPIEWRLPGELGQEKALLREAFEGWLPHDLLWRPKEQFGDGSGTADVMTERVHELVPNDDWADERVADLPAPRSREELAYQRMFAAKLGGIDAKVLGRFATA